MEFIDQSSSELRLSLSDSNFNLESLSVIKSETVSFDNLKIKFGILGASHFVRIKSKNVDLTEIFACADVENSESIRLDNGFDLIKNTNAFRYSFTSNILCWDEVKGKYFYEYMSSEKNSSEIFLSFDFPSEKEGNFQARTSVLIKRDSAAKSISITTMHAYPNENNLIKTYTEFFY